MGFYSLRRAEHIFINPADGELRKKAKRLIIDLLVENNRDVLEFPWDGKKICLDELRWHCLSENRAKYYAAILQERIPEEIELLSEWEKYSLQQGAELSEDVSEWRMAIKVWPENP